MDVGDEVLVEEDALEDLPSSREAEVIEPLFASVGHQISDDKVAVKLKNPHSHANCWIVEKKHVEKL